MMSPSIPGGRCLKGRMRLATATIAAMLTTAPVLQGTPTDTPASRPAPTPVTSQPAETQDPLQFDEDAIDDLELLRLEVPVVVTAASRREQKLNDLPYAVSVITKDDIRLSGARSIPDALRLAVGVDVAETSYGSAATGPRGLHGYFARNTLMMVDGRQMYDALFGANSWGAWPFMLEDIERIEVIRGPAGVTWGANAVNGVINIVTKDPIDQQGLTMTGTGGSRGVAREYTGYGFKIDKLRLRVSGEYERTDGFRKGGTFLMPLNDDYRGGRGSVHAIYDPTPNDSFTLSACSGVTSDLYPTPLMGLFTTGSPNGTQASSLLGRWKHRIADDNRVEATAYVTDFWASNHMRSMDYRYQQFVLQIGHTFRPAANHTLTYGFDSRTDLLDTGNADPSLTSKDFISTAMVGFHAEDEWHFAPKWTLTLGGRMDYDFYGGFQPSARIAMSRELTSDSMAYVAFSRGYQMPPSGMRFTRAAMLGGLAYLTANRDMPATTLVGGEAGYRARLFDRIDTDVSIFCHRYDKFMTEALGFGPPGLLTLDLSNTSDALAYGLEWEGRYRVSDSLTLLANYTLELTDWLGPDPVSATDAIPAPEHKFMLGARYDPWKDLHLSAHMYYVGPTASPDSVNVLFFRHADEYLRLDLRAEYEFWKDRASIAVGARNMLDPDHFEGGTRFMNVAEVPSMIYAEIRIRLDEDSRHK